MTTPSQEQPLQTATERHANWVIPADIDRRIRNGAEGLRLSLMHMGRAAYTTVGIQDEATARYVADWLAGEVVRAFLESWHTERENVLARAAAEQAQEATLTPVQEEAPPIVDQDEFLLL